MQAAGREKGKLLFDKNYKIGHSSASFLQLERCHPYFCSG
jgi:hypothetical protein